MNMYLMEFLGSFLIMFFIGCVFASGLHKDHYDPEWILVGLKFDAERMNVMYALITPVAVLVSCLFFGNNTTYFNSALTLALAIDGTLTWKVAGLYIAAQAVGFLAAAILLSIFFVKLYRNKYPYGAAFVLNSSIGEGLVTSKSTWGKEFGITFLLVFVIRIAWKLPIGNILQIIIVTVVHLFLAYKYKVYRDCAINPVRDLMPRIVLNCLPLGLKGMPRWGQCKASWFGSLIGAVAATWLSGLIFSLLKL